MSYYAHFYFLIMKQLLLLSAFLGLNLASLGQIVCPKELCGNIKGKEIYIPKDLQGMDLHNPDSKWSYQRMCCTDNVAVFWEKGFGYDLANPPQLEGHDMHVDLNNLTDKLEHFYTFSGTPCNSRNRGRRATVTG